MQVDMRIHTPVRDQVHAGLSALRVQARQIWGTKRHTFPEIVLRLMVGVGDLARHARDASVDPDAVREVKKEFGNVIFSTIRWVDDLGLDVLECMDLAIEAQEKFVASGRTR
jgi:hypothetical protein